MLQGGWAARWLQREFSRYFLVSIIALGVDFSLLRRLVESAGVGYVPAVAISFSVGAVVSFALSVFWVFERKSFDSLLNGFVAFWLFGVVGLLVSVFWVWFLVHFFGVLYWVAKVFAAAFSFMANFGLRKFFLFTVRASSSHG